MDYIDNPEYLQPNKDQQFMQTLADIMEDKYIFHQVFFGEPNWTAIFVETINRSVWMKVATINSQYSFTLQVDPAKNATPQQVIDFICLTISQTIEMFDFENRLINAKRDLAKTPIVYLDGIAWVKGYVEDATKIAPMINLIPLLDNMYEIRL